MGHNSTGPPDHLWEVSSWEEVEDSRRRDFSTISWAAFIALQMCKALPPPLFFRGFKITWRVAGQIAWDKLQAHSRILKNT